MLLMSNDRNYSEESNLLMLIEKIWLQFILKHAVILIKID